MSRLQLALNVADLDAAVDFYSRLFAVSPAKRRPGYANFVVADPPLKLVLFAHPEDNGTINHLGIEHETLDAVHAEGRRLHEAGQELLFEENVDCCHARQTKFWVEGPDRQRWENYVVLEDSSPHLEGVTIDAGSKTGCCAAD